MRNDLESIAKPEPLVDIVEMTPLSLEDRRTYNLLIGNAGADIKQKKRHRIERHELTKHTNSNNHDVDARMRRLMSAIAVIKVRHNPNGKTSTRQIQLLGTTEIEDRGGPIDYFFPPELVDVINNTEIFARLHTRVMFELSSKYSLALYEFLQKRKNLRHIDHEILSVEEVRGLLGVPPEKLKAFGHLNDRAIRPAAREVSFLTEYDIAAEPIRRNGRSVSHIRFSWSRKADLGSQIAAVEELNRSKIGRTSRMIAAAYQIDGYNDASAGTETVLPSIDEITSSQICDTSVSQPARHLNPDQPSQICDSSPGLRTRLTPQEKHEARTIVREAGTGWCIDEIARQFHEQVDRKPPDNFTGAWFGFVKNKVKTKP